MSYEQKKKWKSCRTASVAQLIDGLKCNCLLRQDAPYQGQYLAVLEGGFVDNG